MFTFLHAADLHLDSPLVNLARYEGAPVDEVRRASRRALEQLVDLAKAHEAAFLLLAGDLFDGDWRDFDTGLFFRRQMLRLRDAGIAVYLAAGNHDAASRITKSLSLPDNVHICSVREPSTFLLDEPRVAIHGQGFKTEAEIRNLAQGYPEPEPGRFNIGLLHTALTGRPGHGSYAPCTLEELRAKGYDYWALGHVHEHEIPSQEPWVVFPGVLQGRNIRETGPKGCVVVEVDGAGRANVEFAPLDVFRWERCQVDAGGAEDMAQVLGRASSALERAMDRAQGLPVAVRVEIGGACPAHDALAADPEQWATEVRGLAQDVGADRVWVERVVLATAPQCLERNEDQGPLEELAALARELEADPEALQELSGCLDELFRSLPVEYKRARPRMGPGDDDWLRQVLAHAQSLLRERLLAGEGA